MESESEFGSGGGRSACSELQLGTPPWGASRAAPWAKAAPVLTRVPLPNAPPRSPPHTHAPADVIFLGSQLARSPSEEQAGGSTPAGPAPGHLAAGCFPRGSEPPALAPAHLGEGGLPAGQTSSSSGACPPAAGPCLPPLLGILTSRGGCGHLQRVTPRTVPWSPLFTLGSPSGASEAEVPQQSGSPRPLVSSPRSAGPGEGSPLTEVQRCPSSCPSSPRLCPKRFGALRYPQAGY